jgi:hypothetical protein
MLQNPTMSGRIGKWAYVVIEYDLAYEPLKSMKGHVIPDFIVEHRIDDAQELDMSYLTITYWTLSGCSLWIKANCLDCCSCNP